jgi:histidinol phosphatase-like enzyme
LIKTKSGGTFGKGPTDWQLWDPKVKDKLEKLIAEDFKIVIITN